MPGKVQPAGIGHEFGGARAATTLVAALLSGLAHLTAVASVPPGADALASHGAWSVFQYPLDPWRRCHVGSEPVRTEGAAWLLVDVASGDLSLVRLPGEGYRQRGGDEVPQGTITVGSQSIPYWFAPFSADERRDGRSDERVIELMKASESEAADARISVQGETWRGEPVTDAFSLRGFTAALEAANGGACNPRQPDVGEPAAIDLSFVNVEPPDTPGDWYTEIRLLGPFFERGGRETLVIRAIPRDRKDRFGGLSFVNARLDFFRNGALIGRSAFHYFTDLADICISPESGRLEIIVTSTTGGSAGWTDSYFLFFDPHTGRVVSVGRGAHGEEIHDEIEGVDDGTFTPSWCPYRGYMSSVESFARAIMKESFLADFGDRREHVGEVDRIEEAGILRREPRSPLGGHVGFADDIFSSYLDLIARSGPDSPLRFERFDTSDFSVVAIEHSGYSFRDAFQMIFVKEAAGALWTPIYDAGPDNSLARHKLAEVSGFVDAETLRIHMCVEECVPGEWGVYADVNLNLRTFEGVTVPVER